MTTLAQRGPLWRHLALEQLPGARKRVPLRALVLSVAAMGVAAWGAFSGPEILGGYDALSWILIVIPSFLLAYYRGWRGAVQAQCGGVLLVLAAQLVAERFLGIEVNWLFLFLVGTILLAMGLGLGILSELLQRERQTALVLAYSDPLTGLPNRRLLDFALEKEFAAAERGRFLTLVLFDVDGFKTCNDQFGRRVGDEVLQQLAEILDKNTRRMNLSGRHGGDEFLAILSGEKAAGARVFAERTRLAMVERTSPTDVQVTVSAGIASYDPSMRTPADLLDAADRALHAAKTEGGNRSVVLEGSSAAPVRGESLAAERAWTRRAMEEAEVRYRLLFSEVPVGLYRTSPDGRVLDGNEALTRMLGFPNREALLRTNLSELYVDLEDRRRWREHIEREGIIPGFEMRVRRRDGEILWVRDSGRAVPDADGTVLYYEGALEDITERKRAEEALRESEERFRAIFDSAAIGMALVDLEGHPILVNPALEEMLGYSAEELRSMVFTEFTHPDDARADWEMFQEVVAGRREGYQLEKRHYRKDGTLIWGLLTGSLIRDGDGKPRFGLGMVENITERKRLEEQLRLSQRLESVGRLAGGVAHDFNNLLTAILGHADLLLSELPEGHPIRADLEEIKRAGERATSLTRQLLAFGRQQVLHPKVLDLNAVVSEMDRMLRRLIGEDIELCTVLDPELGRVRADPGQLEQVILNLIVNARDAMPSGGRLTIETSNVDLGEPYARKRPVVQPGSYVMLAVSDTGIGMDTETQARIFEPFFTTKEVGKGTGLGLATVYGIVKQSGGYIWVYSEPGQGSTFKIYLPRVEEAVESLPSEAGRAGAPRGTERILIVEDDAAVRRLARGVLERNGYTVLDAGSGGDALELLERHPEAIDLVLTDMVMPGLSGPELAERVVSMRPDTKVLYMSGYTDHVLLRQDRLGPGSAFLQKPFSPEGLARRVREALDRSH